MKEIIRQYIQDQEVMLRKYVKKYFSVKKFNRIMSKLRKLNAYGSENSYWYGDADVYVFIETIDNVECLIINNVVSCYERPLCIIKVETIDDKNFVSAICTNKTSEKSQYNHAFNDRRDYEEVGLDLIKANGFGYLYKDTRDKEWAFGTSIYDGEYENLSRDNTLFILQELDYLADNINDLQR